MIWKRTDLDQAKFFDAIGSDIQEQVRTWDIIINQFVIRNVSVIRENL